ncbi:MAG TPA: UDP-N-acetylglucosamine 1-carboxyvinyltransferase [Candidatus Magasanikbacteria bacterium]|nr:MAG: hypothetical protein A3C10_04080 [Candidatus Magasanikbacteria bacterium RIFCSPHIGHO2_02_FULL_48_18]OGH82543.1 MAG: hypothetical protein A3G08_03760 [Candidatus Magasanikbacteria bacterium RIFCSPLOWO2_12_FULL_47_9b]HAZ28157.1 UDP-N-acetylglucosamine 1-carboxyvinyltransferase [Candidatus Magasanikbacteria bacterium]
MGMFLIHGGKQLHGTIDVTSGKNSPVALLMGSLVIKGKVRLEDMSRVEDVERVLELLESIGVSYAWETEKIVVLDTSKPLTLESIDRQACRKLRISLLLFGALCARERSYKLYKSGGCKLGNRSIFPHAHSLEKFGIRIISKTRWYEVVTRKLAAAHVVMYESGDTATENVILAAVLAPGTTTITFASANYMVQDLCHMLVAAGARIEGIGTTTLTITGVKRLHDVSFAVSPDPVDAMAWISLAVTTQSPLTIRHCPIQFLELELEKLSVMGQKYRLGKKRKAKNGKTDLVDVTIRPSTLSALPDKLYGRPFPGLNIDNVSLFVPLLTQAKGRTLVHDWCYENRALYYLELQKLGAKVTLLDPHRVFIEGPTPLIGNELICPNAIRPAMALLIAMIAAKGTSVLRNTYPIERAYEDLVGRLTHIGVSIQRVDARPDSIVF